MRIDLDDEGGVLIEMESDEEAHDLMVDLLDALESPGEDVTSQLINDDGCTTLTVRCLP